MDTSRAAKRRTAEEWKAFVEGQAVAEGDLLAEIDPRPFQATLQQLDDVNNRQVLKVSLIEGVGGAAGFDEAAVEAANRSTFSPATRDGKPVRGWTPELVYNFKKQN